MPFVVKLIGSGIGLASEAIAARKAEKAAAAARVNAGPSSSSARASPGEFESSRSPESHRSSSNEKDRLRDKYAAEKDNLFDEDAPPPYEYVEVSPEQAGDLFASGLAVPADRKHHTDSDSESDRFEEDEADWALDEAAAEANPRADREEEEQSEPPPKDGFEGIVRAFVAQYPPPPFGSVAARLPCPVIIPQRRPRAKERGFVRAYAPVLEGCGVDQMAFMRFLKDFHQASKASHYLEVIKVGAMIAGFAPSLAVMITTTVIQVAAGTAIELQSRHRSNSYLDLMNQQYFQPRGLYCLVMKYQPTASPLSFSSERLDLTQTIAKYQPGTSSSGGMKDTLKGIRDASGKTVGVLEFPEAAPLVFPALDQAGVPDVGAEDIDEAGGKGKGKKKENKFKAAAKFVADYQDRRAQAIYEMRNPNSPLAQRPVQPTYASRFSDPRHPANSGSLIALVTGGTVDPSKYRERKRQGKDARRIARGRSPRGGPERRQRKGLVGRVMQKDVMYLMVVNLPTPEELANARATLEKAKRQ